MSTMSEKLEEYDGDQYDFCIGDLKAFFTELYYSFIDTCINTPLDDKNS